LPFTVIFHEFTACPVILHIFVTVLVDHFKRAVTDLLGKAFIAMFLYLKLGLSEPERGNYPSDVHIETAYYIHIKKPCHQVREAASYILTLSIIPAV